MTNCHECSEGYIYIFGERDVMSDLWRERGYLSSKGDSKGNSKKFPCV